MFAMERYLTVRSCIIDDAGIRVYRNQIGCNCVVM